MQHALDAARPYWPLIASLILYPLLTAALNWALWWDTPAHWDAFAAAHPGLAFLIRILRAAGPHLRKLVVAWRDYAAARSSLPPLGVALPAEKQGALDVSATRPSVAPSTPTPADGVDAADEDAHASIVPPPPFDPHRTMRGHTSLSAAVVAATLCALVAGVVAMGCPNWNRPACTTPGAYSCVADQPRWCSTTHELTPVGDEPCAAQGRVCALNDAGVARCAPAVDAGVSE